MPHSRQIYHSTHVQNVLVTAAFNVRQNHGVFLDDVSLQINTVIVLVAAEGADPAFPVGVAADQVALQVIHGSEGCRAERTAAGRGRAVPSAAVEGEQVPLEGAAPREHRPAGVTEDRLGRPQVHGGDVCGQLGAVRERGRAVWTGHPGTGIGKRGRNSASCNIDKNCYQGDRTSRPGPAREIHRRQSFPGR